MREGLQKGKGRRRKSGLGLSKLRLVVTDSSGRFHRERKKAAAVRGSKKEREGK